ncbi:MAG: TetR/AcrR family transcriptional regulator [Prevotella sp.]|jgi:AcrR family transcriptional regulator|nr:TetR/AcrR family transcriptional regulator [Prevotella sp.]MCH4181672.1 TetR/AcrR family transcriptional regulator [Prevotella sp.]MCH4211946.1 TetR/AcrR family transcriptional regulator [Prevotella sp.]MCH4240618.1 TetR/AcrR family transcriptional regulator [Prevotella sp.]
MTKSKDNNTEERILEAAKKVFLRDGLQGARMQDIADLALINRSMLHYYFRDKKMLSHQVMKSVISQFIVTFKENLNSDLSFEEKVDNYIEAEIDLAYNNSDMLIFALHEASKDPDFFKKIINNKHSTIFRMQVKEAYEKGEIIMKDSEEFVIMISSLCMFPFIAGPLYMMIFRWDEEKWQSYRSVLRKNLPKWIKQAIFK